MIPSNIQSSWLTLAIFMLVCGSTASGEEITTEEALNASPYGMVKLLERTVSGVLTPEQAESFAAGVAASEIGLANGETLEEFMTRIERAKAAGLVYQALEPCVLLDTRRTGEQFRANESRNLLVRGHTTDYSTHGGEPEGCDIPNLRGDVFYTNRARALMLQIEALEPEGEGELFIWPGTTHPMPGAGLVHYGPNFNHQTAAIVSLCDEESTDPCSQGDIAIRTEKSSTHVVLTVLGFFEPVLQQELALPETDAVDVTKSLTAPYWEPAQEANDIQYSDGDVGIGTDNPRTPLAINAGVGGKDVGITQGQVGGSHAMELTTSDSSGAGQATRLMLRGDTGDADIEFYRGGSGAEELTMMIDGSSGRVGIGTADPQRKLDIRGDMQLLDGIDGNRIFRTAKRTPAGYAGGSAHENNILAFSTPYELEDGTESRSGLALGSPEVWGGETSYLYSFGAKNIRAGIVNDGWRRSEIELYNNNTGYGRILFRTGSWRDPGNVPGVNQNVRMSIEHNGQVQLRSGGVDSQLTMSDYGGAENAAMGYSSDLNKFAIHQTAGGKTNSFLIRHAGNESAPVFSFDTNTTPEAMVVSEHGRVGVGTDTPASILHVARDGSRANLYAERVDGHFVGLFSGTGFSGLGFENSGAFSITVMPAIGGSASQRVLTVTPQHRVGIKTTDPSEALEVDGNIKLSGSLVSDGDICIGNCGS